PEFPRGDRHSHCDSGRPCHVRPRAAAHAVALCGASVGPMSTPGDYAASNLRAIGAMLLGQASFTFNDALIKLATAGLPGGQAIFTRGVMATLLSLAVC